MNEQVKYSINARKKAIVDSYKVNAEQKKEIDDLFLEIENLGETCKDSGEFENKLAASPLNQKYIDMFTKVATADATATAKKGAATGIVTGAMESAAINAVGSTMPTTRAAVNQKAYDAARDIPVVGDAIDVGQKASYLGHLGKMFKKKK